MLFSVYTKNDSNFGFWLRWLCSKFIAFTCALCLHNGRSLQTKNLRSRLAKFPNFESFLVYFNGAISHGHFANDSRLSLCRSL